MHSTSPAVLYRRLAFLCIGVYSLFMTSCTSKFSILDVHAPAVVAHALSRPTAGAVLQTPQAAFTAAPTVTPLPTLTPTSVPATPTDTPSLVSTEVRTAQTSASGASAIPTRLIIPAIGLDAPVVEMGWSVVQEDGQPVSQWDVPNWRAAGWIKVSAPLGAAGNTVLEGHQNMDGSVFENLENLKEGDVVQVFAGPAVRNYTVAIRTIVAEKDQPLAVRHENAKWLAPTHDQRLTLITCYPSNNNTHRLILVAYPQP